MPRGWAAPSTSLMIREYLRKVERASIYEVWKHILSELKDTGYVPPSYQSLRVMVYCLKRLGLVKITAIEPSSKRGFDRHLYSLVRPKVKAKEWLSPIEAAYRRTNFERRMHFKRL